MKQDDRRADESEVVETERKRRTGWLIAALLAAVAIGVLLASTVWTNRWTGEEEAGNEIAEDPVRDLAQWCGTQSTYDLIRRELFRRAAEVRGGDQQAYARLADYALLRVAGPVARGVDEQLESVTCSGTATLDLPPGVAVAGGRRSLTGDIGYSVQTAADGSGNVVRLGNADSIVVPLATLARSGGQGEPLSPPEPANAMIEEPVLPEDEGVPDDDRGEVSAPARANPSFDCDNARTRGEIAVCNDPGLAALDRQMAAQFGQALMEADRSQRRLLERTRGRFLSYRDRCATNQCVADTYRSRMREIGDIMADRWRG